MAAKKSSSAPSDTQQSIKPFIDQSTAIDAYNESKRWLRAYFDPLDEFERLARNRPSSNIPNGLPRVTDGTLAAIVQEQPKRIVQQIATGAVSCYMYPEQAPIADIVLTHRLLNRYNRQGNLLQKSWNMLGKAMTYGLATSYTFFTSTADQFHTDFVIPYVKDILIERGKVFAPDSNVAFMRSWYSRRDLQAIINKEKSLMAKDKNYVSGWDLKALADFMETGAKSKPADVQTPAEKEKGDGYSGGYEVIHAFQTGKGAEFYSFAPNFDEGRPLRVKVNRDPRGEMPLNFLYCNVDLSNPLGRGQVELSGGVQNLIDQQMQMFQFMSTIEMGPPLQVWGNPNKASLKFRPNALWDMGTNPNNKVEPYTASNFALQNFPNNYGLLKSQIMNLNSAQDHSIAAEAGSPTQSKTQAGVQASEQRLGVSDNYLRKQYEGWFQKQSETSLNIFFSEMNGADSIELGSQELKQLENSLAAKFIKNDKLEINYKDIDNVVFDFQVDPSSSKEADDQDQLQKIMEVLQEVGQDGMVLSYYLGQDGYKLNIGELYKQRFERLGLKNIDSILTEMSPDEADQAKQQPFPIIDKPQIRINTADLTAEQIAAALQAGGVNLPQQQPGQQPMNIPPGLSPQATADFIVEMTKAQAQSGQQTGAGPNELALKQRELDLKQQDLAIKAHDSVSKADLADKTHQFNVEKAAVDTIQNAGQQDQQNQLAQQQADTQVQQAQQPEQESPAEDASEPGEANEQPTVGVQPVGNPLTDQLTPQEEQVVHELTMRGFDENDCEQAIVMLRHNVPLDQIVKALAAKKGVPA